MPAHIHEWRLVAENFSDKWNFPNCVGAVDGKHVVMKAPAKSGSLYFNYKGTFSIVLMAVVDANLQFIMIDIGSYGRNSDGGIFAHSNFGKALTGGKLPLPPPRILPGAEHLGPMPYVLVGDEAFPLNQNLMRPYPGRGCTEDQQVFNYRLSRARRVVENGFGVLASRWRIFFTKIGVSPETTKDIVKAAIVLHNMLQRQTTPAQIANLLEDYNQDEVEGLCSLNGTGNRGSTQAIDVRNNFKDYFTHVNLVQWQTNHVRRGYFGDI